MSNLGHMAARTTASKIIDVLVKNIDKDVSTPSWVPHK